MAERHAAIISGEIISGPEMVAAVRNGDMVTVTLAHGTGANDFSPNQAISGFHFTANGQKIEILSATKQNTSIVQLALAHEPANTVEEILYYGYDGMNDLVSENVLKDNSPLLMPLKTGKVIL